MNQMNNFVRYDDLVRMALAVADNFAAEAARRQEIGIGPEVGRVRENPDFYIMPNGVPIHRQRKYWNAHGFLPDRDVTRLYYQVMELMLHRRMSRLPISEQAVVARIFIALQRNQLLEHARFPLFDVSNLEELRLENPQEYMEKYYRMVHFQLEIESLYQELIPDMLNYLNNFDFRHEDRRRREYLERRNRQIRMALQQEPEVPGLQDPQRGGFNDGVFLEEDHVEQADEE